MVEEPLLRFQATAYLFLCFLCNARRLEWLTRKVFDFFTEREMDRDGRKGTGSQERARLSKEIRNWRRKSMNHHLSGMAILVRVEMVDVS